MHPLDHQHTDDSATFPAVLPPRHRRVVAGSVFATGVVLVLGLVALAVFDGGSRDQDDRLLVVDGSGTVSLVDPATGETSFSVGGATPTPDRSELLTTRRKGSQTLLERRSVETGAIVDTTTLDGDLRVRTVSASGNAVALMPGEGGRDPYEPTPRARTQLTIASSSDHSARVFDLPGNLEPEMFSTDEDTLFVLSFEPPTEPTGYTVRKIDLTNGEVTDTESPQVELNPKMNGKARAQVLAPDGSRLFTLYTVRDTTEPITGVNGQTKADSWAFIHVIDLDEKWSYCVFLPAPIGTVDEASVGLAVAPGGGTVYVGDAATGGIAVVDAGSLEVVDDFVLPLPGGVPGSLELAVSDAGDAYLAHGDSVWQVSVEQRAYTLAWTSSAPISGLELRGTELRVAAGGSITRVDVTTGLEIGVIAVPGDGTIDLLGPPSGIVTQFIAECAC